MKDSEKTLFDQVGGLKVLQKVHKRFYNKIYAHPWIGKYFQEFPQEVIESQQTDYMGQNFGGPVYYLGKLPAATHKHMFINAELFELRQALLLEALKEENVSPELIIKWLKIDSSFKNSIIKKSISDCEKRYMTDEILAFENPDKLKRTEQ